MDLVYLAEEVADFNLDVKEWNKNMEHSWLSEVSPIGSAFDKVRPQGSNGFYFISWLLTMGNELEESLSYLGSLSFQRRAVELRAKGMILDQALRNARKHLTVNHKKFEEIANNSPMDIARENDPYGILFSLAENRMTLIEALEKLDIYLNLYEDTDGSISSLLVELDVLRLSLELD